MTSDDLKRPQLTSNKIKNTMKAGSVHDNVEINKHYLDEIRHKINS